MERDNDAGGFSENLLDLGAVISKMLEPKLLRLTAEAEPGGPLAIVDEAFDRTVLPVVEINRKTLSIQRINAAASQFFARVRGPALDQPEPIELAAGSGLIFPGASHFIEVLEKACQSNSGPSQRWGGRGKDLSHTGCAFALRSFVGDSGNHVWVQLIPENFLPDSAGKSTAAGGSEKRGRQAAHQAASSAEDDALVELSRRCPQFGALAAADCL